MKFTLSWLKRHLKTNATPQEIEKKLSLVGLEVEGFLDKGLIYRDFMIAEIVDTKNHPDAQKLNICTVNTGKETLQIVCGAPNARPNIKVVLAPVGVKIPLNGMEIKASKIRGIDSNGMLCSAEELMLGGDSDGIIELPESAVVGHKYADYANLNEILYDISITPNRGDATYVKGIARDLAAAGLGELISHDEANIKTSGETKTNVVIEDKDGCHEFSLRAINGINNGATSELASPFMRSVGSSPKTALVDISNFTMMDFGRPNHIHDADKVEGNVVIRRSKKGEKFVPISQEEIELPEGILVVCDNSGVIAVAGVMGGETTKVTEGTKNILVEVANFDPIAVANSGRILNLHSDSRFRFERTIDYGNTEQFSNYITNIILDECGGSACDLKIVKGNQAQFIQTVDFDFDYVEKLAGVKIAKEQSIKILSDLGFKVNGSSVSIPTFRQGHVTLKADIVEEVIRIYGYENIPSTSFEALQAQLEYKAQHIVDKIKNRCAALGYNELVSWAFVSNKMSRMFDFKNPFEVANPISSEMVIMRQSFVPSLFEAYIANDARGVEDLSVFECGSLFDKESAHSLNRCVAGLRVGKLERKTHFKSERDFDFYDVKGDVFAMIELFGLDPQKIQIKLDAPLYYHSGKSCSFYLGKMLLGYCGEIHPMVLKELGIKQNACAFEVFIDNFPPSKVKHARSKLTLSNYQKVDRDFAFIMEEKITSAEIVDTIKKLDKNLIESVNIFDVYQGKNIDENKKSVALSVRLSPPDRTLSENEINEVSKKIIDEVTVKFAASLR